MIEVRINLSNAMTQLGFIPKRLKRAGSKIVSELGKDMYKNAIYNAAILGNYPGGGNLARNGLIFNVTSKRASIRAAPGYIRQIDLLEDGPGAGYPKTIYYSTATPKMRQWMQSRMGAGVQQVKVGGSRTSWGKPSRRFITNARRETMSKFDRIVKVNIQKIVGGK